MAFSLRCSSNGSGRFGARPAQAQEQLVRGVRLVPGVEQGLHGVTYRWDVPELGVDTRLGGRLGQDGLEVFLLGTGEFRRVLVPGMPCQHRAHPRGPPLGQPFQHCPLSALNHFRNDADTDSFRGIQDSFCFHPNQHTIVGTPPPPDQDGGLLRGDPDPHPPPHPKRRRKSMKNTISFHASHTKGIFSNFY